MERRGRKKKKSLEESAATIQFRQKIHPADAGAAWGRHVEPPQGSRTSGEGKEDGEAAKGRTINCCPSRESKKALASKDETSTCSKGKGGHQPRKGTREITFTNHKRPERLCARKPGRMKKWAAGRSGVWCTGVKGKKGENERGGVGNQGGIRYFDEKCAAYLKPNLNRGLRIASTVRKRDHLTAQPAWGKKGTGKTNQGKVTLKTNAVRSRHMTWVALAGRKGRGGTTDQGDIINRLSSDLLGKE